MGEFGDRDAIVAEIAERFPSLEIHGNAEHDPFRIPCVAQLPPGNTDVLDELEAWVEAKGTLRVIISGFGDYRFIDVCSTHADKGLAVEYLFGSGGFPGVADKSRILMAGDSGNRPNSDTSTQSRRDAHSSAAASAIARGLFCAGIYCRWRS